MSDDIKIPDEFNLPTDMDWDKLNLNYTLAKHEVDLYIAQYQEHIKRGIPHWQECDYMGDVMQHLAKAVRALDKAALDLYVESK